jgi:hypothetical protein
MQKSDLCSKIDRCCYWERIDDLKKLPIQDMEKILSNTEDLTNELYII